MILFREGLGRGVVVFETHVCMDGWMSMGERREESWRGEVAGR